MSAGLILGAIGTTLGGLNFLYWAWWARRERVIIREQKFGAEIRTRENEKGVAETESIYIESNFKLVRTRGENDIYFESAYLSLDKALCQQLNRYFDMPRNCKIHWILSPYPHIGSEPDYWLRKFESKHFALYHNCNRRQEVDKLNHVEPKIKQLEAKYIICWIDSQENKWSYRFPSKWWSKFVPERLWWRI